MPLLECRNLRKTFGKLTAVENVSLSINEGEVVGLLGPNGAGKSTTMNMLSGLLTPDSGSILFDHKEVRPGDHRRTRALGFVPQDLAIYPELSAVENLNFFARLYGVRGSTLARKREEILHWTGLEQAAHQAAGTYSGGMKRRLNFGVGLMHSPRIVILDEPTVGVDPQSRAHLLQCVRQLAETGVSMIYVSHYMEEVEAVCKRVAIIDHGIVVANDELATLLSGVQAQVYLHVSDLNRGREALGGNTEVATLPDGADVLVLNRRNGSWNGVLKEASERLSHERVDVLAVDTYEQNLERLFLKLTGNRLRDN